MSVTPTITYEHNNCKVVPVPRNLFHVTDINAHSPIAAWNAISISVHRQNYGTSARWTLHIPLVAFGAQHDYGRFDISVDSAFANLPNS